MSAFSLSAPLLHDPRLVAAAKAMNRGNLADAERHLHALLGDNPLDLRAIRLMGELAGSLGRYDDAERLFRQAIAIAPNLTAVRCQLALLLFRTNQISEALVELARINAAEPRNVEYRDLQAAALRGITVTGAKTPKLTPPYSTPHRTQLCRRMMPTETWHIHQVSAERIAIAAAAARVSTPSFS